jgi:HK97 gp10 family phage protein
VAVTVVFNPIGLAELRYNPLLLAEIKEDMQPVIRDAQAAAPKRSGRGAASIGAEIVYEGVPAVRVGWDVTHYYMRFHELGTKHLPARPFLRPAVDRYLDVVQQR